MPARADVVVAIRRLHACWRHPRDGANPRSRPPTCITSATRRVLGLNFTSKVSLPDQTSWLPGAPPDWIQILVALAAGRLGDVALDDLQRPATFFAKTLHPDRLHRAVHERGQSVDDVPARAPHRRLFYEFSCRGPDDALALQPHPRGTGSRRRPAPASALRRLHAEEPSPALRPRAAMLHPGTRRSPGRSWQPATGTKQLTWRPPPRARMAARGATKTLFVVLTTHRRSPTSYGGRTTPGGPGPRHPCGSASVSPLDARRGGRPRRPGHRRRRRRHPRRGPKTAAMFRGFEIIWYGKDPQAGLPSASAPPAGICARQPPVQPACALGHRMAHHRAPAQRHFWCATSPRAARRFRSRFRATTTPAVRLST